MTAQRLETQLRRQRFFTRLWKAVSIVLAMVAMGAVFSDQIRSLLQAGLGVLSRCCSSLGGVA